jgi:AcrR family transcriptional regulator
MGTEDRKSREKIELKDLILESSKSILLKSGKEGLSIRKIAAEIEYSPATIYLYFKDKDAILHELMEKGFEMLGEYMNDSWNEEDPAKRIHLIGKAYVQFALDHKDWYDLMFNSSRPMKHIEKCMEDWDAGVRMFNLIVDICKQHVEKSNRHHLKPDILALQLWTSVHGLVNLAQSDRLDIVRPNDKENLIYETLDSIYYSIFAS